MPSRLKYAALAFGTATGACYAQRADESPITISIWPLFVESFDAFSVVLIVGSLAAMALIVQCVLDVRSKRILPEATSKEIDRLLKDKDIEALRQFTNGDLAFVSRVLAAVFRSSGRGKDVIRESAELAASEQCARWFRAIEPLNIIGNLAPLVGLAGTVWGMIIAFTTLGAAGGQAGAADLSLGISKALFHTLLGLCLAIPCMLVFGMYRNVVDRICNQAMIESADYTDRLVDLLDSES